MKLHGSWYLGVGQVRPFIVTLLRWKNVCVVVTGEGAFVLSLWTTSAAGGSLWLIA